ncbi:MULTISPECIES: hypothetical protein [unclassified Acinetobacter]|uniref:hypothetical protein n=1 Tax=unclassified Acinetobacter TaxID=196816 RepID=UPI0015BA1F89|nr:MULTISPECIES: hypothetical protein [unclassified Acinetobacter]MCL5768132.1 hypothetical protein [Acinetobacter sp. ANC5681]NWK81443.1 hypothetical protein [Acinetobacter sp. SwsAc4]
MSLHQAVNIAIFGLSLRTLNELKEHVQTAIPSHIQVNWSNIAEPHLDILMINHIFFDSPNIKSLIQNNHINVLQIANNADKNSSIEDDILYLPLNHLHSLHQWLNERLAKNAAIEKVSPPQATNTTIHRKQIGEVLQEILNPKNGKIQLFDHNGLIAIADPRNEWVWQNPMLQTLHTDPSLNYTYATQNDQLWITETPQQDLKQWLWNLLWASKDFNELCPPSASSFYLEIWPQPINKIERQDILRMAACFAKGAEISVVASQLKLPEQRVKQFVAASLGANYGKIIKDHQANYHPQNNQNMTEQNFMKKLFGRLRNRLGF